MSFIGSAINSAFTPAGTNQRNNEVNQQSGYSSSVYNSLWPGLNSYLKNTQAFQNSQLPNLEQGVQNAYSYTTQGGRNALDEAYAGQQQAGARQQMAQAAGMAPGNPALAKGMGLAAMNSANTNSGNFAAQTNSAAGQQQAMANYANLLSAASPNYSGLSAMNSSLYGQPQVPVGQGLGSALGALIPTLSGSSGVGNLLSGIFGG